MAEYAEFEEAAGAAGVMAGGAALHPTNTARTLFVKGGKGVVGFHAASDAYYGTRAWGEMIGGYFAGHKAGNEKIHVVNEDPKSPLTAVFEGKEFEYADEG